MLCPYHLLSTAVMAACAISLLNSPTKSEASAKAYPTQATIQRSAVPALSVSDMGPIQSPQPQRWVF